MAKKKPKRQSRSIIIGHLEKINSKVFDQYHKQITEIIKGNTGVYALYRRDKLYYIGLATDFHRRINQHLKDRHKGKWSYFSLYIIRKSDHIREVETLLLRIAKPEGNYQKGKLKSSRNLAPQLKRLMTEGFKEFLDKTFGDRRKAPRMVKSRVLKGDKRDKPLKGFFPKGKRIYAHYKGADYKAFVFRTGTVKYNGQLYDSPSAAG
ncbi:MAG: GIY-YIG nuclease family protein, partial [Sedimentisphaerales bacterium]|nr:GIY-YIG nuclease family protein [Sedimentisphaerales bacterium]